MPVITPIHPVAKGALLATNGEASFAVDHLYVDDNGKIRDANVEHLFDDLFYGRPLDAIFTNNFRQYVELLTEVEDISDRVFTDESTMLEWVSQHFGTLVIDAPDNVTLRANPDLLHCTARATFRKPRRFDIPSCYAPTALNAGLLCVVTVLRQLAQAFNDKNFKASPGELH